MNDLQQGVVTLLKSAITGEKLSLPEGFSIEEAMPLIKKHYLYTMAYTGAVKENVIDNEELAYRLMELLWKYYPDTVRERYKVDMPEETPGYELLEEAGRKRGFLLARGEINTERMAKVLLDEYRSGKLGFFTLEAPEDAV